MKLDYHPKQLAFQILSDSDIASWNRLAKFEELVARSDLQPIQLPKHVQLHAERRVRLLAHTIRLIFRTVTDGWFHLLEHRYKFILRVFFIFLFIARGIFGLLLRTVQHVRTFR